jgi:hypothetical protein
MDVNRSRDTNVMWRRIWKAFHSPVLLLPAFLTCTAAAAIDVTEVVPKFGLFLGATIGVFLVVGILISFADLVPHLVRWLRVAQVGLMRKLRRLGRKLRALSERIATIVAE